VQSAWCCPFDLRSLTSLGYTLCCHTNFVFSTRMRKIWALTSIEKHLQFRVDAVGGFPFFRSKKITDVTLLLKLFSIVFRDSFVSSTIFSNDSAKLSRLIETYRDLSRLIDVIDYSVTQQYWYPTINGALFPHFLFCACSSHQWGLLI
jgi:hypothetical protein